LTVESCRGVDKRLHDHLRAWLGMESAKRWATKAEDLTQEEAQAHLQDMFAFPQQWCPRAANLKDLALPLREWQEWSAAVVPCSCSRK